MKWFEGGIPAAIQSAKNNNSVFIVFVSGGDGEACAGMEERLHSEEVTQLCESKKCVAVKIDSESNDCKFFSQIYPVVLIPSTFLIAHSGVPLEVIGEVKSTEDFLAKFQAAIDMQEKMSSEASSKASAPSGATNSAGEASTSTEDVSVSEAVAGSTETEGEGNLEDKVERAKELVEQKRQEKMRKEAEDERRREIERRQVGQSVQRLKEQQKKQEMMEASKEYRKQKEEDKLARQRVKEAIARDKAEKDARFGQEREARHKAQEEERKRKLEEQAQLQADMARRSEFARIQFRLPDGSSVTHQFPATDTFSTVHSFISEHCGSTVTLSTTFPRRTFTADDFNSTLQELELAPSAAILVMPASMRQGSVRSSSEPSMVMSLLNLVFAPLWFVWSTLSSLLGLSGARPANSSTSQQAKREPATSQGGDRNPGNAQRRQVAGTSRQEGAVHRFHNAEDDKDPDDQSTWNGNSTQQM